MADLGKKLKETLDYLHDNLLIYLTFSVLVLVLLNSHGLLLEFLGTSKGAHVDLKPLSDNLVNFQDKISTPSLIAVWFGIGTLYYASMLFLRDGVGLFLRHRRFSKEIDKVPVVLIAEKRHNGRLLLKTVAWCAIYFLVFFRWLLPLASGWFYKGIFAGNIPEQILLILAGVLFNCLILIGFVTSFRLLIRHWKQVRPYNPAPQPVFKE